MSKRTRWVTRSGEFLWPGLALIVGVVWTGDAIVNKVVDSEYGTAVGELLLGGGALWYAVRGIRSALRPNVPPVVPESPVVRSDLPLKYLEVTRRIVQIAEKRTPVDCVTRVDLLSALQADDGEGIWTRWGLNHTLPPLDAEENAQVLAVLGSDASAIPAVFTTGALEVVEAAERLARHCQMDSVHPGHLAAAVVASTGAPLSAVGDLLHEYLGVEVSGFEQALRPSTSLPSESGHARENPPISRSVTPQPKDRSAVGRWAYPLGACLLLLSVSPFLSTLPLLLSDSAKFEEVEVAIADGSLAKATELLDDLEQRHSDSFRVYAARACVAAKQNDDASWAANVQLALLAGMPWSNVGQCKPAVELGQFILVRTGGGVLLRVRPNEAATSMTVIEARTAAVEDTIAEMVDASCANGSGGYAVLGAGQALAALGLAASVGNYAATSDTLKACLDDWPEGRARSTVEGWLDEA